ncbi:MAG: hypothetical protein GPOALKHO_000938 [Sodalis sp.]|nr:MAG: hypothetical protein GPOALKHO_000938 [Sodalis sp.]
MLAVTTRMTLLSCCQRVAIGVTQARAAGMQIGALDYRLNKERNGSDGAVHLLGHDLTALNKNAVLHTHIGFVFQSFMLVPILTALKMCNCQRC